MRDRFQHIFCASKSESGHFLWPPIRLDKNPKNTYLPCAELERVQLKGMLYET